ncbi:DUF3488 and transglutaminase-like domain-containing protein [Arthrobacter sp. zg-Y411]|uniref:transglutaminase TgpA family protein n=1 Tax=Arthrobacter zhangbolii TaxID=2886936 RepID=UPI001D15C7A1|nr:DUF3488 and transglutaminase-like domain-containing protein [Arthrobacter zhangbolii]MCC3295275.1 DUF3488 and transglutaminase-like domain-containing protein [Arthrobacter zhangbolii]
MTAVLNRPAPDPQPHRPAGPGRRTAPGRGSANLGVGAATAAAVLLCSLSLHGVIEGWSWLAPLVLAVLLPLAATAGARRLGLPLPLIPVAGVAALIMTLTGLFASSVSPLGFLPGPGTLARADALLLEARTIIITEVTPVQALPGIVFLCCAGIGLVAVLSDTLAATLRMPATAGLGLVAVVMIPAVLLPESLGAGYFTLAAVGYLLVLGAGARREHQPAVPGAGPPRGWLGRCAAVSGAALILALMLPLVLPGFTAGAFPQGTRFNFWSGTTGLNPVVTLGNDLRQPQSAGRITYATSSDEPVYLRSTTLEDFSGSRWAPDLRTGERRNGVSGMGSDGGSSLSDKRVVTRISSDTYSSPWLLAPYYPVGVTGAEGSWSWDPKTMTVLNDDDDGPAPQAYQVVSVLAAPTPQQLALAPPVPEGTVDPVFTELPDSLPGNIAEATREAVGSAGTPYAKAMAIQDYLRSAEFSYSLDAPVDGGYDGNGLDVLSKFMDRKAGYCVHFAAAMAVMARQEGIPSRMALGYAPGRSTGKDSEVPGPGGESMRLFEVDSTDAHAWPELYFEDAGWVRFEPTPSRGSVPDYAQQQAQTQPSTNPRADEDPRIGEAVPAPRPTPRETPLAPEAVLEPAETGSTAWLWTAAAVLAAAAAACTPWSLRRLRTLRRRNASTVSNAARSAPVWDELADLGQDYGYPGQVSDTPRSYADRLARQAGFNAGAQEALDRIRRAYEEELYSRAARQAQGTQHGQPPPGQSGTAVRSPAADWSDIRTVESALGRTARLPDRLRARFLPPSLAVRFRHD